MFESDSGGGGQKKSKVFDLVDSISRDLAYTRRTCDKFFVLRGVLQ